MKNNILKFTAIIFAIGLFSFSCNEDTINITDEDYIVAQDNVQSEIIVNEVFDLIFKGALTSKAVESCPSILLDVNVLTINYPVEGCTGIDGTKRSGTITAIFDVNSIGSWTVNDYVSITFTDYKTNDNSITGTIGITCTSVQPLKFSLTSDNMLITLSNSQTISWITTLYYTMQDGSSTADLSDDTWQIDGTSSGIGANGKNFSREAIALIKKPECKYFVFGNLVITVNNTTIYDVEFINQCGTILIGYNGLQFPLYMQ